MASIQEQLGLLLQLARFKQSQRPTAPRAPTPTEERKEERAAGRSRFFGMLEGLTPGGGGDVERFLAQREIRRAQGEDFISREEAKEMLGEEPLGFLGRDEEERIELSRQLVASGNVDFQPDPQMRELLARQDPDDPVLTKAEEAQEAFQTAETAEQTRIMEQAAERGMSTADFIATTKAETAQQNLRFTDPSQFKAEEIGQQILDGGLPEEAVFDAPAAIRGKVAKHLGIEADYDYATEMGIQDFTLAREHRRLVKRVEGALDFKKSAQNFERVVNPSDDEFTEIVKSGRPYFVENVKLGKEDIKVVHALKAGPGSPQEIIGTFQKRIEEIEFEAREPSLTTRGEFPGLGGALPSQGGMPPIVTERMPTTEEMFQTLTENRIPIEEGAPEDKVLAVYRGWLRWKQMQTDMAVVE